MIFFSLLRLKDIEVSLLMPRRTSLTNPSNLDEQQTFATKKASVDEDGGRTVGILGVIVIGFFWVAGGIYGNEQLIATGTPGLILWGVVAGGLLFALPFALMCAELATTYPENGLYLCFYFFVLLLSTLILLLNRVSLFICFKNLGGVIVPVRYALGMTSANHMAYLNWIVNALDASIYPLLGMFEANLLFF